MDRNFTILQNVARDLAVVKNEMEHQTKSIEELKETLKKHQEDDDKNFRDLNRFKWITIGGLTLLQFTVPFIFKYLTK